MQLHNYKVAPLCTSDHKPVSAVFGAKVKAINKEKQQTVLSELSKAANLDQAQIKPIEEAVLVDVSATPRLLGMVVSYFSLFIFCFFLFGKRRKVEHSTKTFFFFVC